MGELEKYSILSVGVLLVLFFVLAFVGRDALDDDPQGSPALIAGGDADDERNASDADLGLDARGSAPRTLPIAPPPSAHEAAPPLAHEASPTRERAPGDDLPLQPTRAGRDEDRPVGPDGRNGGVAVQPPSPPPAVVPVDAPVVHTIQPGDTFSSLAERYLGDRKAWKRIQDENPGVDPARLQVGQKIQIPAVGGKSGAPSGAKPAAKSGNGAALDAARTRTGAPVPSTAANGKPTKTPAARGPRTYTVQSGDSLSRIAERFYGDPLQYKRILAANKGAVKDPAVLAPGLVLVVP